MRVSEWLCCCCYGLGWLFVVVAPIQPSKTTKSYINKHWRHRISTKEPCVSANARRKRKRVPPSPTATTTTSRFKLRLCASAYRWRVYVHTRTTRTNAKKQHNSIGEFNERLLCVGKMSEREWQQQQQQQQQQTRAKNSKQEQRTTNSMMDMCISHLSTRDPWRPENKRWCVSMSDGIFFPYVIEVSPAFHDGARPNEAMLQLRWLTLAQEPPLFCTDLSDRPWRDWAFLVCKSHTSTKSTRTMTLGKLNTNNK